MHARPAAGPGRRLMAAWRRAAVVLLAGGATVAAALATPVTLPEAGRAKDPGGLLPESRFEPEPEDLGAFLESRRWGVFVEEKPAGEPPPPEAPALNPALARMGFVGLIVTGDESAVLLESPEGEILRVAPGETVPDGRTLVSVTDNQLVLKGEAAPEEVLTLFPSVRSAPAGAEGGGPRGGDGARADASLAGAPSAPGAGATQ